MAIPVDKLGSGDERLDRHLHEALAADRHRQILFRMDSYDIAGKAAPGTALAASAAAKKT